jgi:GT2 family glycosyltransferase
MKDVAVIIINYNTSKYTLECIQAVIAKTSEAVSYEIIVVDNNSELSDYKNLRDNFPKQSNISLHRSDLNTGFGGGNMFGVQFANATYLLFLNNDAMLKNDCLNILFRFMETHPKVGVCTAQNYDEHNKFVPSFDHNKGIRRLLFGRSFLEKINPKTYPKRKQEYTSPIEVNWVNGAFLFFRNEAFQKIGGFDTHIFLYWEEMDLCHRLRKQGFSSALVPEAQILHYQGVSIGNSETIDKEAYISYLYVLRKNSGFLKYVFIRKYLIFVILLKPKKWYLLSVLLKLNPSKASIKHKQKARILDEN